MVALAEEHLARAKITEIHELLNGHPGSLPEGKGKPVAGSDDDHSIAKLFGNHVVDVTGIPIDPALALPFYRYEHHQVTAFGERLFVRSVVGQTAVAIALPFDSGSVSEERWEIVRGQHETERIINLICPEYRRSLIPQPGDTDEERQRRRILQPLGIHVAAERAAMNSSVVENIAHCINDVLVINYKNIFYMITYNWQRFIEKLCHHRIGNGVKDWHFFSCVFEDLAAFARRDARDNLRTVFDGKLRVTRAKAAGDALEGGPQQRSARPRRCGRARLPAGRLPGELGGKGHQHA